MKNFSITLSIVLALLYSFSSFSQTCFDSAIGGFENSGWTEGSGDFTMDPNYVYEGNWGLTNPTGNTIESSPIAVPSGISIFQLSWWYWSPHNSPDWLRVRLKWYNSSNTLISTTTRNFSLRSYYAWRNGIIYVPAIANATSVVISYENISSNIIYFDAQCLSEYLGPEGCIDPDNGFEFGTGYTFSGGAGISTALVYEGVSSLRLPDGGSATTTNIPVNGGSNYELSYYHRTQTHANAPNTIEVTFTWYDAANAQISQDINTHNRSHLFWSNRILAHMTSILIIIVCLRYFLHKYPYPMQMQTKETQ